MVIIIILRLLFFDEYELTNKITHNKHTVFLLRHDRNKVPTSDIRWEVRRKELPPLPFLGEGGNK